MKYLATDARLSEDGQYRYTLERWWGDTVLTHQPACLFVMLNPSTADALEDDPTIRRCVGFADKFGYSRLIVVNLFAFRATDPRDVYKAADPVGPDNDATILHRAKKAGIVIAGWGNHGGFKGRDVEVVRMIQSAGVAVHHLGLTSQGKPSHPLYLKADSQPIRWEGV